MSRSAFFAVLCVALGLGPGGALAQAPPVPNPNAAQMPNDLVHAMAMSAKGTLAIQAVQGTKDGPPVGGEEVEVVVFCREQPVQQISSKLDDRGVLMVNDLPVSLGIRVLVRVKHAGVLYQDASPLMDDSNPQASVSVTVYEVTDEAPAWRIVARQLAGAMVADGIDVAETVVFENPSDRTWLGAPADAQGRRATARLTLPPDAVEIELLQGFHGWCCSEFQQPELVVQMPMMPGQLTRRFAYKIPVRGGASDMRVKSDAPTEHSIFVVPAVGLTAAGEGVTQTESSSVADVPVIRFEGGPHAGGALVGLTLSGVELPSAMGSVRPVAGAPAPSAARGGSWMNWAIGGALAVAVGVWVLRAAVRGRVPRP